MMRCDRHDCHDPRLPGFGPGPWDFGPQHGHFGCQGFGPGPHHRRVFGLRHHGHHGFGPGHHGFPGFGPGRHGPAGFGPGPHGFPGFGSGHHGPRDFGPCHFGPHSRRDRRHCRRQGKGHHRHGAWVLGCNFDNDPDNCDDFCECDDTLERQELISIIQALAVKTPASSSPQPTAPPAAPAAESAPSTSAQGQ